MKYWKTLIILLNIAVEAWCMQPYIDAKLLSRDEKQNLRILRIAIDACKQNPSHFFNYVPCKTPYTPLALAQSIPNFFPLAEELILHTKKRKTSGGATAQVIDAKSLDLFDGYRLRALHFYLDACRANPTHLNKIMPYTIPNLPLSISAASDKFLPITKELLKMGARPNIFNHSIGGHAPIFKAIQHNARKTIALLIRHGALLFFVRKSPKHQTRIFFGNTIDPQRLWAKDREAFVYAQREFALRMLLLCGTKRECIVAYAPKDVLKMIVSRIT